MKLLNLFLFCLPFNAQTQLICAYCWILHFMFQNLLIQETIFYIYSCAMAAQKLISFYLNNKTREKMSFTRWHHHTGKDFSWFHSFHIRKVFIAETWNGKWQRKRNLWRSTDFVVLAQFSWELWELSIFSWNVVLNSPMLHWNISVLSVKIKMLCSRSVSNKTPNIMS